MNNSQSISTHRVIQLSTLVERLHAAAAQNNRAAADIRNRTMANRFSSRVVRYRSLAEYIVRTRPILSAAPSTDHKGRQL